MSNATLSPKDTVSTMAKSSIHMGHPFSCANLERKLTRTACCGF
jgi:hypothetical protein